MPDYIDTHAHLYMDEYLQDLKEVVSRANQAGVNQIILPAIDLKSSFKAISIADNFDNIYVCVGIHPHESAKVSDNDLFKIEELIKHPKVVAIGEIGLDYYYNFSPKDKQKEIFCLQVEMAFRNNLPVVIHTRESMNDAIKFISEYIVNNRSLNCSKQDTKRGVFHCFSGALQEANQLFELGFYISFPGIVTFKKTNLPSLIKEIGIEKLLLETDSPYMSPVPFRGKRNEPSNIIYISRKISEILQITEKEVGRITSDNARNLFNLKKPDAND